MSTTKRNGSALGRRSRISGQWLILLIAAGAVAVLLPHIPMPLQWSHTLEQVSAAAEVLVGTVLVVSGAAALSRRSQGGR